MRCLAGRGPARCLAPGPGGPFTGRGQPECLGLRPGRCPFPVPAVGRLVLVCPGRWLPPGSCPLRVPAVGRLVLVCPGRWLPPGSCPLPVGPSRLVAASPRGRTPVTVPVWPAARGFAVRPRGPVPLVVMVPAAAGTLAVRPCRRLVALPLIPAPAAALTVSPGTRWFAPRRRAVTPVTAGWLAVTRLPRRSVSFAAGTITFCPHLVIACGLS